MTRSVMMHHVTVTNVCFSSGEAFLPDLPVHVEWSSERTFSILISFTALSTIPLTFSSKQCRFSCRRSAREVPWIQTNKRFQPSNSSGIPLHDGILLEAFYCGTQTVIASVRLPSTWGSTNQPFKSNCRVAGPQRQMRSPPGWMSSILWSAILVPSKQLCFGIKINK